MKSIVAPLKSLEAFQKYLVSTYQLKVYSHMVRGFTLNVSGREVLNYQTMKENIMGGTIDDCFDENDDAMVRALDRTLGPLFNFRLETPGYDRPVPQVGEDTATWA